MFQLRRILHPTDFSPHSQYAYEIATELAARHQAALLVLHVVETLGPENVTYGEAVSQPQPEGYRGRLWDDLRRQTPPLRPEVRAQQLLAEGDTVAEIKRVADEQHCDLIVMGTHGHTGLLHLLMGSTTERVIRVAPCPVLTAKLPHTPPDS
ncbi:MAG TPA: universal stress protein [Gemmataceae bacterium]|jgi:nucleotide-binding universal stress UspA family protein|nr:universal stress protein [Gemmataceae bacterium]